MAERLEKRMSVKSMVRLGVPCQNCESKEYFFTEKHSGYGFMSDLRLWTCVKCGRTFSYTTEEILAEAVNEL